MQQDDPMISATEAMNLIKERLKRDISLNKVSKMMREGEIPSEESLFDRRKRIARRSEVVKWIEKVLAQEGKLEGRAALAIA
jgi:hypothetical protein